MTQQIKPDSYYTRVEILLRDHETIREDLERRLAQLRYDLVDVPSAVCLRGYPSDMEVIPGSKDPDARILGDIDKIKREERACEGEIRRVKGELHEMDRLVECVNRLPGKPGMVLRSLYFDGMNWESVMESLQCQKNTVAHHRHKGIVSLANRMYSRARTG